jgi:hypothetical protein
MQNLKAKNVTATVSGSEIILFSAVKAFMPEFQVRVLNTKAIQRKDTKVTGQAIFQSLNFEFSIIQ